MNKQSLLFFTIFQFEHQRISYIFSKELPINKQYGEYFFDSFIPLYKEYLEKIIPREKPDDLIERDEYKIV